MMNLPPPDPRSSRIGFDEVIGIIVAFTTIGTILVVSLGQKDKVFNLNRFINPSPPDRATKTTGEGIPVVPLPAVTPKETIVRTPVAIDPTPSPSPDTSLPAAPATPATPAATLRSLPNSPPPVPVPLAPKANVLPEKSPAKTVRSVKFSDVPEDLWARPYIDALATQGILNGFRDGTFKPNSSITRAEFATLLQKTFKQEPKSKGSNFKDVSAKFWASPAIQDSVKTGFLRGYPNNVFRPNEKIPKIQVLVALVNGLKLTSAPASKEVLQTYQDAAQIPKYATGQVSAATKAGLVVNYPNPKLLNPNRNATRAEVVALVYQALVKAGKAKAIPSQYVVKP